MSLEIVESNKGSLSERINSVMANSSIEATLRKALGDNKDAFIASIIELASTNEDLKSCKPAALVREALKAATLNLPINPSLGHAYIIPYRKGRKTGRKDENGLDIWDNTVEPQFQLGYKGIMQLAFRTGQYKIINAGAVLEGQLLNHNYLTGEFELGEPTGDKVVGYFAYFELKSGYKKGLYWTISAVEKHAMKYSPSYKAAIEARKDPKKKQPKSVIWIENFDEMAIKTVMRQLMLKFGQLSIAVAQTLSEDDFDVALNANQEHLDFDDSVIDSPSAIGEMIENAAIVSKNEPPKADWEKALDEAELKESKVVKKGKEGK